MLKNSGRRRRWWWRVGVRKEGKEPKKTEVRKHNFVYEVVLKQL